MALPPQPFDSSCNPDPYGVNPDLANEIFADLPSGSGGVWILQWGNNTITPDVTAGHVKITTHVARSRPGLTFCIGQGSNQQHACVLQAENNVICTSVDWTRSQAPACSTALTSQLSNAWAHGFKALCCSDQACHLADEIANNPNQQVYCGVADEELWLCVADSGYGSAECVQVVRTESESKDTICSTRYLTSSSSSSLPVHTNAGSSTSTQSSSTSTSTTETVNTDKGKNHLGIIIGAALAGVFIIVAAVVGVIWFKKRRKTILRPLPDNAESSSTKLTETPEPPPRANVVEVRGGNFTSVAGNMHTYNTTINNYHITQ